MNINFTISVTTFEKAAEIEKALKGLGLDYQTNVVDKPSLGAGRKPIRARIGKVELLAVMSCIDAHPKWTWKEVSRATGVGSSTVGRIKSGTHPLQLNSGESHEVSIRPE